MAITLSTAARDAACNAIVDLVDGGSGTATLVIGTTGMATELATFDLANPAFGASSTGTATLLGTTITDSSADNDGTAAEFQVQDRDGAVIWSGSVTETGSGGDVTIDNVVIAQGQTVNLTGFTFTQPAS
jgi:chemotaxis protein CheY-P-specific phosphatase CheC